MHENVVDAVAGRLENLLPGPSTGLNDDSVSTMGFDPTEHYTGWHRVLTATNVTSLARGEVM